MKQTIKVNMSNVLRGFSGDQILLKSSLDKDTLASSVFAHLINTAALVFSNRLILGGSYQVNYEDKMEILNNLRKISKILDKYYKDIDLEELYSPDPDEPWWNK